MKTAPHWVWTLLALAAGSALSFLGFGLLWIGTPWPLQGLMLVPFLLVAYAFSRLGVDAPLMLVGAAPIGLLLLKFRDKDDSHLLPTLIVAAWVAGVLAGHFLGKREAAGRGRAD